MNTYYYGVRSQKEPMDEVGEVVSLPIKRMFSFMFSPDSSKIALMGLDDKHQRDMSLIIAERDTAAERKVLEEAEAEKDTTNEKMKPKVLWKKKEVDFGRFHQFFSWSPNGKKIAYSKYHFGNNQSSIWDIRVYDIETGRGQWLTDTRRATYPIWSPDGKTMVYVSHRNGVANLYKMDSMGGEVVSITSFSEILRFLHQLGLRKAKALPLPKLVQTKTWICGYLISRAGRRTVLRNMLQWTSYRSGLLMEHPSPLPLTEAAHPIFTLSVWVIWI